MLARNYRVCHACSGARVADGGHAVVVVDLVLWSRVVVSPGAAAPGIGAVRMLVCKGMVLGIHCTEPLGSRKACLSDGVGNWVRSDDGRVLRKRKLGSPATDEAQVGALASKPRDHK